MPALTTVITHATGDVYPASDWNTYNRDNVNYLIAAGADLASAATITPTNEFHGVTGVTTIDNLTPATPVAGQRIRLWIKGGPLTIRNNGGGTGNIRTLSGVERVAATNEIVEFMYDAVATVWREAQPGVGLVKLWDSVDAGVALPAASITTPTLPQNFKHLRIVWLIHGDTGSAPAIAMRFNGDTGANYEWAWFQVISPSTVNANSGGGATSAGLGNVPGATDGATLAGAGFAVIPHYAGTTYRKPYTFQTQYSVAASINAQSGGGSWRTAATAITTLTFLLTNFAAGSRITVYGEA